MQSQIRSTSRSACTRCEARSSAKRLTAELNECRDPQGCLEIVPAYVGIWCQVPFGQGCLPVRSFRYRRQVRALAGGQRRVHGAELAVHLRKAGPPLRVALPAGLDQRPVGCGQVVWHGRPHAVEHLVQYLQVKMEFSGTVLLLAQSHHAPLQTCLLLQAPLPSGP